MSIVRDSFGEPHIRGESAAATMYGFGYAQMQDQADYLLRNIYRSIGRSAEVEGSDCEPSLEACFLADQTTRLFRVPESAYERFDSLPVDDQARFRAFAAGINAYVADHPDSVPPWAGSAGPVTAEDVVASTGWSFLMAQVANASKRLTFPLDPSPTAAVANSEGADSPGASSRANSSKRLIDSVQDPAFRVEMKASNMFVVDGSRTASGKPILNVDPHLEFTGATQWYQAQLTYPGVSVQGVTFRGFPAIGIGNNGHVAWGHTANSTKHEEDVYREILDPANPNRYMYDGKSVPMTLRTAEIKAQVAPGVVESIPVTFRYTVHGPVVTDPPAGLDGSQPTPAVDVAGSVTTSVYEQIGLASEMWRQAEARNMDQFKQAMSDVQLSNFHTMAADSDGNIFYVAQSRSGVLNESPQVDFSNGWLDGSDSHNTWLSSDPARPWTGVIPFDDLPQADNPASGYFQNANNSPWTTAPGQIEITDLPFYMQKGANRTRSRRQVQLLDPAFGLTLADVDAFGMDTYIEFAPALLDLLRLAEAKYPGNAKLAAAAGLFDSWDYRADADSTWYPLFNTWVRALKPNVLGFEPLEASAPYPDGLVGQPGGPTTQQVDEAARAMAASGQAYDAMIAKLGTINPRFGDIHTMDWGNFSGPVGGTGNSVQTLFMTQCRGTGSQAVIFPCPAQSGSGYIMNYDFSTGAMHTSKPASASDDSGSPFHMKNAEVFAASRYRAFPISEAAVDAEMTSMTELSYRSSSLPRKAIARMRHISGKLDRKGRLKIKMRCSLTGMKHCDGNIVIKARRHQFTDRKFKRKRARRQMKRISKRGYNIPRGTRVIRVRLSRNARKRLRNNRMKVRVSWSVRQPESSNLRHRKTIRLRKTT
ncbi:MAG: penicillin acylase family protein [Solirubrobacterales bacterium]